MEQKKREEDNTTLPTNFLTMDNTNHLMDATMEAVSGLSTGLADLPATVGYFCGFIALKREVQMNTEKISTTQYMPAQNSRGCRDPIMS